MGLYFLHPYQLGKTVNCLQTYYTECDELFKIFHVYGDKSVALTVHLLHLLCRSNP